jgi:hypothetical protein
LRVANGNRKKGLFEKIRLLYNSSVIIASLETFLALRTAVLRAEVAGRGWNKEKGQSKNPLVICQCGCGVLLCCIFVVVYCLVGLPLALPVAWLCPIALRVNGRQGACPLQTTKKPYENGVA